MLNSTLKARLAREPKSALLGACLLLWATPAAANAQEGAPPKTQPAQASEQGETPDPDAPVTGFEAWQRMAVLAGGEWHAAEGQGKPVFRRFLPGPKGACLFVETRDKSNLEEPLREVNVIFYDPVEDAVRGIAVGANGAFFDSQYHWEGDLLINRQSYHISDGLMDEGEVKARSFTLVERWAFESDERYHWSLFQQDETGVSQLVSTDFTRQKKPTPLPAVPADTHKPVANIKPLSILEGDRKSSGWNLEGNWIAGARALWTQRSMPNPFGEAHLDVHGFHYFNPYQKKFQYIGFSQNGDLLRGTTKTAGDSVMETDYRITPFTPEKLSPEKVPTAQLGETLIPLQNHTLKATWVLAPPGESPKVIDTDLKVQ